MTKLDKIPAPSESVEQQCLFRWADFMAGQYPVLKLMHHIPNEGKRSRSTGARMKAEGLKPGFPDICLPVPVGKYHGLYIEMKAGKNTTTQNQDDWLEALSGQGYFTAVCWGWEQAAVVVTKYLGVKVYER
jgi:hypothetical protein